MGIFVHCSILAYETCVRFIQKNVLCSLPNCTEELPIFFSQTVINTYYKDNRSTN